MNGCHKRGQIVWPEMVKSAIHEEKVLEFNSFTNWQPMNIEQNGCNVIYVSQ